LPDLVIPYSIENSAGQHVISELLLPFGFMMKGGCSLRTFRGNPNETAGIASFFINFAK
jgi:hypothetical protein